MQKVRIASILWGILILFSNCTAQGAVDEAPTPPGLLRGNTTWKALLTEGELKEFFEYMASHPPSLGELFSNPEVIKSTLDTMRERYCLDPDAPPLSPSDSSDPRSININNKSLTFFYNHIFASQTSTNFMAFLITAQKNPSSFATETDYLEQATSHFVDILNFFTCYAKRNTKVLKEMSYYLLTFSKMTRIVRNCLSTALPGYYNHVSSRFGYIVLPTDSNQHLCFMESAFGLLPWLVNRNDNIMLSTELSQHHKASITTYNIGPWNSEKNSLLTLGSWRTFIDQTYLDRLVTADCSASPSALMMVFKPHTPLASKGEIHDPADPRLHSLHLETAAGIYVSGARSTWDEERTSTARYYRGVGGATPFEQAPITYRITAPTDALKDPMPELIKDKPSGAGAGISSSSRTAAGAGAPLPSEDMALPSYENPLQYMLVQYMNKRDPKSKAHRKMPSIFLPSLTPNSVDALADIVSEELKTDVFYDSTGNSIEAGRILAMLGMGCMPTEEDINMLVNEVMKTDEPKTKRGKPRTPAQRRKAVKKSLTQSLKKEGAAHLEALEKQAEDYWKSQLLPLLHKTLTETAAPTEDTVSTPSPVSSAPVETTVEAADPSASPSLEAIWAEIEKAQAEAKRAKDEAKAEARAAWHASHPSESDEDETKTDESESDSKTTWTAKDLEERAELKKSYGFKALTSALREILAGFKIDMEVDKSTGSSHFVLKATYAGREIKVDYKRFHGHGKENKKRTSVLVRIINEILPQLGFFPKS